MLQSDYTVYGYTFRKINSEAYFKKPYHEGKPLHIGTFVFKRSFSHVQFTDKLEPFRIVP